MKKPSFALYHRAAITTESNYGRPRAASSNASEVPFMESITSVSELPALAEHPSRPQQSGGKWERIARDFRLAEFAISVLMYGFALFFAKIQVAQRTYGSCSTGGLCLSILCVGRAFE